MTLISPGYIFTSCQSHFLCVSCHTFTIFVVSVGLCSCSTCCWTDFRFCQQDLRQHGTWGSHGGTGWPASPDLQNLEKKKPRPPRGVGKRDITTTCYPVVTILLSACPSTPSTYTLFVTQAHIPLPVCVCMCACFSPASVRHTP